MLDHPILIFGMPRSGTTWLGKIFDSHPATLYLHEPDSVRPMRDIPRVVEAESIGNYLPLIRDYFSTYTKLRVTKVRGKQPVFPKDYQSAVSHGVHRISVMLAKVASRMMPSFPVLTPMGKDRSQIRIVWKSIESSGRLRLAAEAFPTARAIYLLRHPCGFVASQLRGRRQHKFAQDYAPSEDYSLFKELINSALAQRRGLTIEALKQLEPLERLAWRWALFNERVLADAEQCRNSMVLRYEDLCLEPLETAKRLFDFAGLAWPAQTQAFVESSISTDVSDYYSVFKDPMKAALRWQAELSEEQIRRISAVVAGSRGGALYEMLSHDGCRQ